MAARDRGPDPEATVGLVHHVELYVSDLATSAAFWGFLLQELGYEPYQEFEGGVSFKKGPTALVLKQVEDRHRDPAPNRCRVGLNHIAFYARDRMQVDAITELLHARMEPILYEDRHPYAGGPGHYAVYLEDPDRIKIEIVAPQGYVPPETKPGAVPLA